MRRSSLIFTTRLRRQAKAFLANTADYIKGRTMPQQQIACPQCKQPIVVNIEQLFDVTSDPGAKQRLLGGVSNVARCQACGYEGPLATPIVYHDNEKSKEKVLYTLPKYIKHFQKLGYTFEAL